MQHSVAMSAEPSQALWLHPDGHLSITKVHVQHELQAGEALVEVLYSGVNPADTEHAALGVHSTVAGYDFCGRVKACGPLCSYQVGDVIAGCTPTGLNRPAIFGSHQDFIIYPNNLAFNVPSTMPLAHAACLMVTTRTAADALFNLFGLPLPGEDAANIGQGALLVWGAGTSLGLATVQFAKAVGVSTIIGTASKPNHELLKRLGCTECFDYRDGNVVEGIQKWAKTRSEKICWVMDAVGSSSARTAEIAASCGSPDAKVVTARFHPKYAMPLAMTEDDNTFELEHIGKTTVPARREDAKRAQEALLWAVRNYGVRFELPVVNVLDSSLEDAVQMIEKIRAGSAGLGKFVLKHPL
ncbi:hypothetical protein B0I35DRAFT_402497 [Stachybotrys elegans]|uniref:Enoyl reductase (ER) domain-containing protein n=1 Tax=Stachybotrys elegans TaxID=80388 RepID=A0A8K0SBL9_9HYPO|nr:hypothetical protein B0I35DRAFT_402497 [Stachybotrys elegans]